MPSEPHVKAPLEKGGRRGGVREGKRRGWLRERIEDREEREAESSHKTRPSEMCLQRRPVVVLSVSLWSLTSACAMPSFKVGEESAIYTTEESWCSPIRSLSLPQQSRVGLKLPFHCGQRFGLSGKVKNSEKSGLVKGGSCLLSGPSCLLSAPPTGT